MRELLWEFGKSRSFSSSIASRRWLELRFMSLANDRCQPCDRPTFRACEYMNKRRVIIVYVLIMTITIIILLIIILIRIIHMMIMIKNIIILIIKLNILSNKSLSGFHYAKLCVAAGLPGFLWALRTRSNLKGNSIINYLSFVFFHKEKCRYCHIQQRPRKHILFDTLIWIPLW